MEFVNFNPGSDTEKNKEVILEREQHYLDLFSPPLNVNKTAGSMLGYRHSEENLLKMRAKPVKFKEVNLN